MNLQSSLEGKGGNYTFERITSQALKRLYFKKKSKFFLALDFPLVLQYLTTHLPHQYRLHNHQH